MISQRRIYRRQILAQGRTNIMNGNEIVWGLAAPGGRKKRQMKFSLLWESIWNFCILADISATRARIHTKYYCVRTMSADVPPPPVGSIGPWGAGEGELKTQKIRGGLIRAAESYHFYFSQRCQMWSSM